MLQLLYRLSNNIEMSSLVVKHLIHAVLIGQPVKLLRDRSVAEIRRHTVPKVLRKGCSAPAPI